MIVSVFLPIGPCGQGAFGLLQLANVLRNLSRTASGTNGDSPGNGGLGGLYSAGEIQVMASAVYGCSVMCVSPCLTPCDAKWGEAREKTHTSLEALLFYGALDYFGSSMP